MKSVTHHWILAVVGTLMSLSVLSGCGKDQQDMGSLTADIKAIENLLQREVVAVESGDLGAQLDLRTADVVEMPPGELPFVGLDGYRQWAQNNPYTYEVTAATDEVEVTGDWAFARFTYTWTLTPVSGGEPIMENGKGMWIVKRDLDGSWKIAREIWNSSEFVE